MDVNTSAVLVPSKCIFNEFDKDIDTISPKWERDIR